MIHYGIVDFFGVFDIMAKVSVPKGIQTTSHNAPQFAGFCVFWNFCVTTSPFIRYNMYGLGYWHSLNDVVTELAYPRPLKKYMQIKIKSTGFKLTEGLRVLAEEKLLSPVQKRLGSELPAEHFLEVELAKVTEHHEEGRIWKCEANLALPHIKQTLYARAMAESLEVAIDDAKDEILREISDYKNKRSSKFLRVARQLKDYVHVTRLAQRAGDFYRRMRRK